MEVRVTAVLGNRTVKLEDIGDARVRAGLQAAAQQVGQKLAPLICSTHKRGPRDVRIHFDKSGAADLQYDSCCDELTQAIGRALG